MEGIKVKEVTNVQETTTGDRHAYKQEAAPVPEMAPMQSVEEGPALAEEQEAETDDEFVLPKWIKELGDDKFQVKTRKATYVIVDPDYEEIVKLKRRTLGGKLNQSSTDNFEIGLISTCVISPKLTDMDVRKLKASEFMRLRTAIYKVFDAENFLSE